MHKEFYFVGTGVPDGPWLLKIKIKQPINIQNNPHLPKKTKTKKAKSNPY